MSGTEKKFERKLASKKHLAGWSANQWAAATSPDRVATQIAERYIRHFTSAMGDFGVIPFTGVELNLFPIGEQSNAMVEYIRTASEQYRLRYAQRVECTEIIQGLKRVPFFAHRPKNNIALGKCLTLRSVFTKLVTQGFLDNKDMDRLETYPDPQILAYLTPEASELVKHYYDFIKKLRENPAKNSGTITVGLNQTEGEFTGRVYVDSAQEVEIATSPASPINTVARVNALKKLSYEATNEYEQLFQKSKYISSNSTAPRSAVAQAMRNHLKPFNLNYGDQNQNSGEHLNLSLLRKAAHSYASIHAAQNDKTARDIFSTDNLFKHTQIRKLFLKAYASFLPDSILLALGNHNPFSYYSGRRPFMKDKGPGGFEQCPSASSRIELRSYNDAASNISLSMLGVMAVTYAVVREMMDDPEIKRKCGTSYFTSITDDDTARVWKKLTARYAIEERVCDNLDEAKILFRDRSLVWKIMQEYAQEHAKSAQETGVLMEELKEFHYALCERADKLLTKHVHAFPTF